MFKTICQQEAVGGNTQGGVMMKATPAPSLVVAQAELLLQFLVVPLNAPAHLGHPDQFDKRSIDRQRRQPVLRRFSLAAWPFDQQPLLLTQGSMSLVAMRRSYSERCKTRGQFRVGPLAPLYRAPAARWQAFSQLFYTHWLCTRTASPSVSADVLLSLAAWGAAALCL